MFRECVGIVADGQKSKVQSLAATGLHSPLIERLEKAGGAFRGQAPRFTQTLAALDGVWDRFGSGCLLNDVAAEPVIHES